MLTATSVSFCGNIAWIGLIVPHIVKTFIGTNANKTIILSASFGATLTLVADVISRSLTQSEIPISAITGIFGSIIFILILINQNYKKRFIVFLNKENTKSNFNICLNEKFNCVNKQYSDLTNNNYRFLNQKAIIKLNSICFSYSPYTTILNNISLDIYENEILFLYGANGQGKTTLLKIIAGVLIPTKGCVYIKFNSKYKHVSSDYIDINNLSLLQKSKMISYVKQNFTDIKNILVFDYLLLGMVNELRFYEKPNATQIDRIYRYANELNILHLLNKKFFEISGGEKQLVAICQCLLQNSKVLILDEPTSSLDINNQKLVIDLFGKLAKNNNKSIIITTHNIDYRISYDYRSILIDQGSIMKNKL